MTKTLLALALVASLVGNAYLWDRTEVLSGALFEQTNKTVDLRIDILVAKSNALEGEPAALALDRLYWQNVGQNATAEYAMPVMAAAKEPDR